MFWTADFFGDQLSLTVHVHKLECLVKRLLWWFWTSVNVCPDNISDRSNLVWWCIIISQSIIQKYYFAMFKFKATNVSTRSSEILKLLQSKLVWWYIIPRQVRHCEKVFLLLHRVWDREYGLGDCGLDCCHSWPPWYLKQGSIPVPIKKMWKEHCFCNEYTCLLSFLVNGSSVWFLYPFYLWWGLHNMWDRLLIKCDWLLTLESKKQISLWHV